MQLQRHDLVWLSPDLSFPLSIKDWILARRPCVVARNHGIIAEDQITLAACLGPQKSPLTRISFTAQRSLIYRTMPALAITQVLSLSQQAKIAQLLGRLNKLGCELQVYGSYAWQALTGDRYVQANSDLDLLIQVSDGRILAHLGGILSELEQFISRRVDGELVFAGAFAVAWREWYSNATQLLTKTLSSVSLCSREELLTKVPYGEFIYRTGALSQSGFKF